MKINEITIKKDGQKKYDFHWDESRGGFAVTIDDEEQAFFKAKDPKWDRSGAQELAKKAMNRLRGDAIVKQQKEEEHKYQYDKPLSSLELEWAGMMKRFMTLNDKELVRWKNLNSVVRKSLHDGSHPFMKEEE